MSYHLHDLPRKFKKKTSFPFSKAKTEYNRPIAFTMLRLAIAMERRNKETCMKEPDGMREFLAYHKRMSVIMTLLCLACAAALFIAVPGDFAWCGGFAIGAAAQLFVFKFLDVQVIKKTAESPDASKMASVKKMYLSMVIYAAAVLLIYKLHLNVWSFVLGMFAPKLMLIADMYLRPNVFEKHGDGGDASL